LIEQIEGEEKLTIDVSTPSNKKQPGKNLRRKMG